MIKLSTGFVHRCAKPVGIAQDYARYLTALVRSRLADEPVHRIARATMYGAFGRAMYNVGTTPASAKKCETSIN
jgi:hypothetical protein